LFMSEGNHFEKENRQLLEVREQVGEVVVGLSDLVDRLLVSLLCNGHVLIEGVPGLAKTLTVSTLRWGWSFHGFNSRPTCCQGT